jgi:lipoic acid synthetase
VLRYVEPAIFDDFTGIAGTLGFAHAACGPLVRSSYHADRQAHDAAVAKASAPPN